MPGFNVCASGNDNGLAATLETARVHRWKLTILEPLEQIVLVAFKAQRPRPEIDEITVHRGQDEIYFPGKNRWAPVDITFYEEMGDFSDKCADFIYRWWSRSVVNLQTSRIGQDYKKLCIYEMTNAKGETLWTYELANAWPIKVSPDDLDYSSTKIAEITVTLKFDKAIEYNVGSASQ